MILVSDAGSQFQVSGSGRSGGLVKTAMRATDILWDRVWQLEMDNFHRAPGFLFASISDVISQSQDPTAPHPEVQRRAARIRTDLDGFSDLEIRSLVQHGYCMARKACRSESEFFGKDMPSQPPWDPRPGIDESSQSHVADMAAPGKHTVNSVRELADSSRRKILQTLISFRDWPSYLWLGLILLLISWGPYQIYKMQKQAQRAEMVLNAIAETSPLYRRILERLESSPIDSLKGLPFADVESMEPPNYHGFEIVTDARIIDLRAMFDGSDESELSVHSEMRVRRTEDSVDNTHLRIQRKLHVDELTFACLNPRLNPTLTRMKQGHGVFLWQLDLDFSRIPIGDEVDVITDSMLIPEVASQTDDEGRFNFSISTETGLTTIWVLMPEGRRYESLEMSKHSIDNPNAPEEVVPTVQVEMPLGSLITFQLVNPDANYLYTCRWKWSE